MNINKLREVMKRNNINHYIIPSSDPHQSEYVAEYYKGRAYISNFTGSAGVLLVSENEAKLWTDGRYFIQAEKELVDTGIDLMKMLTSGYPTLNEYIETNIKEGETLGFFGECYPVSSYKELLKISKENNFNLTIEKDLLEEVWDDRPSLPSAKVISHSTEYCGKSTIEKVEEIRKEMKNKKVENFLLASLDDIAWTFNIRGNDVKFNPVVISYGLITMEEVFLYIDKSKLSEDILNILNNEKVIIKDYKEVFEDIKEIKNSVYLNENKLNAKIYSLIPDEIQKINGINITTTLKAIKNEVELKNLKNCQVRDGVAMVKFIKWLKENVSVDEITEITASNKLFDFRKEQGALEESFETIAGYKEHAAMMHYSATSETDYKIKPEHMLLVDSGGQYLDGTTDITRTFIMGEITSEEKRDFTLVLKGHINLAMAKFLKGTCGCNLDILARGPMWKYGIDYKCGTGHGVGFFLNVHEGPQNISPRLIDIALKPGMIVTNEPGVYKEGSFGIRTENTLLVTKSEETEFGDFYEFKTISYCPIDLNGIDESLLSEEEKEWLNKYHKEVYDELSPFLNKEEKEFLKAETREL